MHILPKSYQNRPGLIVIGVIFVFAAILRFYKLDRTILFGSDQGLDMISIWLMEKTGNLPLVGPFLSLTDVYTPPTYYLINWILYSFARSVVSLVYGYALLNLITILILIKLTHDMMGMRTAIFISLLLAISNVMIDHSRTFWQPYPVQFFLALSLMFFWWAYRAKRLLMLFGAVLLYQIGLSVYPSPIVLLPFVGYHTFRWYYRATKKIPASIALTLLTFSISFIAVFSPQLIFEATHGFPTITALFSSDTSFQMVHSVMSIAQNSYLLISAFFATDRLPRQFAVTATIIIGALYAALIHMTRPGDDRVNDKFFPVWTFVMGFSAFLFFPYEAHRHRVLALLPFMFLYTARLLHRAWQKNTVTKISGGVLLLIFTVLNLRGAMWYWSGTTPDQIDQTKLVARYIHSDMEKRGIPTGTSAGLFYKIPDDLENGSYGIYRILFWLVRDMGLSFPLNSQDIHLPHDYSTPVLKPYMYIICQGFSSAQSIDDLCVYPVIQSAPYSKLTEESFANLTVVVLSSGIISGTPYTTRE